ncbi:MAG: hypothetical protein HFG20_09995 [Anaerotruncus sp.]|nr:hypothetical protein [Anaerotruncus sp.]
MLAKYRWAVILIVICMVLSGCSGFNPMPENLMSPPRLSPEQKEIEDALSAAVVSKPVLKYPKSGDYRSAFVFHDIDGDNEEEALAFYCTENDPYTRVCLLDRDEKGKWGAPPYELAGADQDVEFVAFARVVDTDSDNIVIGWGNPDDDRITLGIYVYENGELKTLLNGTQQETVFQEYLIDDIDRDGQDDIILLNNSSSTATIKLVTQQDDHASITDTHRLSDSIIRFAGVIAGRVSTETPQRGVFIDELVMGDVLVTEVFSMEHDQLVPIVTQDMDSPLSVPEDGSEPKELLSLYDQGARQNTANREDDSPAPVCADINSDLVIEIPTARLMPGYRNETEAERLYLTEYNQLNGDFLKRVFAAAINRVGGYRVEFPENWIDRVTVVTQIENGEWKFLEYHENASHPLEDLSGELARIRVVSKKDYQDKFLESYVKITERGMFTYYGYVPEQVRSELAISAATLTRQLFSLI